MKALGCTGLEELERFRGIRRLHNHWSRPIGRPAYFWYLTFEKCAHLHSLARECQKAISFPYYDLTPVSDLHLTIDRVAFDGDITQNQLTAIEAAATRACREIPPFDITIGALGGTVGAIGFTAFPAQPIQDLRDTLRAATLSVFPKAPVKRSDFHPHVAIAYSNSDGVPAAEAIAAVEALNPTARVNVTISEGALVLLERRSRSYAWQLVSRVPLSQ
jgi:2'-5' RNA ligase